MQVQILNHTSRIAFLVIVLLGGSGILYAQVSSTATSIGIDAKIIAPITIENTGSTPINFGTVSRASIAGSVTVTADETRTSTGGVSVLNSSSFSAAPFGVSGENSATFNITLPVNGTVELTRSGGSEKMAVNDFTHNSNLLLSTGGTSTFNVGATLTVAADQVPGEYSGSFSVTVAYQ
ncbi:MAG: DUF4402 domain-containing protein [Bacteroidales bacterium]|nr:DUF4402 domain-containing protein [Bacteroidales bacterium]